MRLDSKRGIHWKLGSLGIYIERFRDKEEKVRAIECGGDAEQVMEILNSIENRVLTVQVKTQR